MRGAATARRRETCGWLSTRHQSGGPGADPGRLRLLSTRTLDRWVLLELADHPLEFLTLDDRNAIRQREPTGLVGCASARHEDRSRRPLCCVHTEQLPHLGNTHLVRFPLLRLDEDSTLLAIEDQVDAPIGTRAGLGDPISLTNYRSVFRDFQKDRTPYDIAFF